VLLQPGKADAGALFSNTVTTTAFGARGTQTLLAKITIGAASVFMLSALMLSLPAVRGARSVVDSTKEQPAPAPAATPTPAANATASPAGSPSSSPTGSPAAKTEAKPAEPAKSPAAQASPAKK
jgi:protein translocase SecG subunit